MHANSIAVPALEPHCNSWVATRKVDGSVIGEFYERSSLLRLNPETVRIETAAQYLGRVNSSIRNGG